MTLDELNAIAERRSCCKTYGESVSLTGQERDELVALARDGMRYRWLRDEACSRNARVRERALSLLDAGEWWADKDAAIDAAMAKEEA